MKPKVFLKNEKDHSMVDDMRNWVRKELSFLGIGNKSKVFDDSEG